MSARNRSSPHVPDEKALKLPLITPAISSRHARNVAINPCDEFTTLQRMMLVDALKEERYASLDPSRDRKDEETYRWP